MDLTAPTHHHSYDRGERRRAPNDDGAIARVRLVLGSSRRCGTRLGGKGTGEPNELDREHHTWMDALTDLPTVTCDPRRKDCSGEQLPRVRPPASSGFPPATPAAHQRSPQAHNRPQYALPLSFGHGGNLLRDRGGLHGVSPHLGYN